MLERLYLIPGGQGQNTDVGTGAEVLTASQKAIAFRLKALPGNAGVVYYKTNGTATVANAMPLAAGEESPIIAAPDFDLTNISVIASALAQAVAFEWYV